MRLLLPGGSAGGDEVDLDEMYATPAAGRWVRANFAASADGAVETGGTSTGVSSAADKRIFSVLRGLCDVVLVGAGTARAEGYGPVRPKPDRRAVRLASGLAEVATIAVVTSDLAMNFDSELFTDTDVLPILLTTDKAPADRVQRAENVAEVVVCGEEHVDVGRALDALHDRGHRVVLCEGGPSLFGQLVAAHRLDELCLTSSPLLVGQGHRSLLDSAEFSSVHLTLAHLLEEDGSLFLRYLLGADAGTN